MTIKDLKALINNLDDEINVLIEDLDDERYFYVRTADVEGKSLYLGFKQNSWK